MKAEVSLEHAGYEKVSLEAPERLCRRCLGTDTTPEHEPYVG